MAALNGSIRVQGCYKLSFVKRSYIIKKVCTKEGRGSGRCGQMRTKGEVVRGNADVHKKQQLLAVIIIF